MSQFHDVLFPLPIGLGARGGPQRLTEIVERASGFEERNTPWAHSRRRWDAGPGVKSKDDLASLISFFEERRGQLYAFRFKDPADHKSCLPSQTPSSSDQMIGTGDGVNRIFPLIKTYGTGATAYVRAITHPVVVSVLAAVDGSPAAFSLDSDNAIVFDAPPADGVTITAGYEFDIPVRFEADRLELSLDSFEGGDAGPVSLVEVTLI